MHSSPHDARSTVSGGGLGWVVGLLIVLGSIGVTIGTVLGTPLGGHATAPYLPFAHGIAHDRPGEPDEAPPHLRDLPPIARPLTVDAPAASTESFPHLP
jgi:hypothetical protein